MIRRRQDWFDHLKAYNILIADVPFSWGRHDCVLYAAGAVEAQTGHDFAASFRGHYTTEIGAARAIRKFGAGTLEASVTACLGEPIHIARAKRGDVVMYNGSLGICLGPRSSFVGRNVGHEGLFGIPTRLCEQAWRVAF